jgi:hypothetical protein
VNEQPAAVAERMAVRLLDGTADRRPDVREKEGDSMCAARSRRLASFRPATLPDAVRIIAFMGLALTVGVLLAGAGCGGDDKPSYCSDVSDLKSSVDDLENYDLSSGVSGLSSELSTIESQAKTAVSAAKQDFPSETSAVDSSISTLKSAVQELPSSPSSQQVLGLAPDVAGVVKSVQDFQSATNSKC